MIVHDAIISAIANTGLRATLVPQFRLSINQTPGFPGEVITSDLRAPANNPASRVGDTLGFRDAPRNTGSRGSIPVAAGAGPGFVHGTLKCAGVRRREVRECPRLLPILNDSVVSRTTNCLDPFIRRSPGVFYDCRQQLFWSGRPHDLRKYQTDPAGDYK